MIGKTLSHFEVVGHLGTGGMGEVYRARDLKLGRQVALKLLPPEVATDPERLARFEREARILATLNHPNVAALYQLEEAGGQRFLVMELVEGRPSTTHSCQKGSISRPFSTWLSPCRRDSRCA